MKIENTIDSLTHELRHSEIKLKKLRNLRRDTESNILTEISWQRYLQKQLDALTSAKQSSESTNTVLNNTKE